MIQHGSLNSRLSSRWHTDGTREGKDLPSPATKPPTAARLLRRANRTVLVSRTLALSSILCPDRKWTWRHERSRKFTGFDL
jgi:hypothetical protein